MAFSPGGVEIPYESGSYSIQVKLTRDAILNDAETLYEAAFQYDDVFVKADILHKGKNGWELYEVKSSTALKDIYGPDVSLQYYVLNGSGISVARACLAHINNGYVRYGDIDPSRFFTIVDMTDAVRQLQTAVRGEVAAQKEMLKGDVPTTDIGPWCSDPYDCDFTGHCWQHIPEVSVFSLRGNRKLRFALYDRGIIRLDDVMPEELPPPQRQQVEAMRGQEVYVNRDEIRAFLDSLRYPLYFLDFETFADAVPRFDGIRPFQNVPYQYSLHVMDNSFAPLRHFEYLALPGIDPRRELTDKLMNEIPENACVLAYVAGFEKGMLQNLAAWTPGYMNKIEQIAGNIIDLAYPFQKRFLYHWKFNGSYSIKSVLPALVPDVGYEGMEIRDGEMAGIAYARMCRTRDEAEIAKIRKALLDYCRLDTYAMVKLFEVLKNHLR